MVNFSSTLFASAFLSMQAAALTDGKCHALVLSGGSNNGAWETGVIWGLTHYGNAEDFAWDVVSGVSAGAINTGGIATWATGTEYEMTQWLSDKWTTISNDVIWARREGGPYDLLFKEPSFLDDSPALVTLQDIVSDKGEIARRFVVSAVDVGTGEYFAMTQENTTFDDLAQSSLSSGSIPVVFPPQHLNGRILMDGGTVWNVNVDSAIQQCMEMVDDPADIVLDVAICGYSAPPGGEVSGNAIHNWNLAKQARDFYGGSNSFYAQLEPYPGLEARYYFQERNSCPGAGGLDFNNSTTWCLQEAGRADAKAMLDIGSDNISTTLNEWRQDRTLKKEYPHFRDYLNMVYESIFN